MKAAAFNQQITIQRPTRTKNSLGEPEPTQWQTVSEPWAAITTQKATEIVSLARPAGERRAVFAVRTPFDYAADWRVLWNGEAYAIDGVTYPPRKGLAIIEGRFVPGAGGQ